MKTFYVFLVLLCGCASVKTTTTFNVGVDKKVPQTPDIPSNVSLNFTITQEW